MASIKDIFEKAKDENGNVTLASFEKASKEADAKFTDLSEGKYVSKQKYDDDIKAKDTTIDTLNGTIETRDTDLADLQKKLENAGTDEAKLGELSTQLSDLQTKYDTDTKNYQEKLSKQAYEFAVKEFAATKEFSSNAAKRDFINSMLAKDLKMENNTILGADDFVTMYSKENEDAFKVKQPEQKPDPKPHFVNPTGGADNPPEDNNGFNFNFTGVRSSEKK